MIIKIVTHYFEDDVDEIGDYAEIDVYVDNELVITYGDCYHDKGQEKSEGFIDAMKFIHGNSLVVEYDSVADYI